MANDGTVKIGSELDQSGLRKGIKDLGSFAKSGFSAIGSAAATMAKTSLAAIGGMVTAIGGASAAAYKFGTDYETSLAKVSTIADTSKVSLSDLSKSILTLSNDTGESASSLNEALYSAISAGADTAHAVDLVNVAVKSARGGFTDTETAVDGLTSALNAYGMATTDAEGLANKFLVTQNLGKTTFGELASSIGGVAPTAHAAGASIDELLSGVAALTANGIGTSEAMTGIKAALSNVIKPTSEASKLAEQLGLDFSVAAMQSKGFAGFLADVQKATGGNTDQMAQLFGSVEALNTILTLTSDQGAALMNKTMQEMATNTTALDDAYEAMSNTAQVHVQKIGNSFKNLGIQIYQDNKGPVAEFTGLLAGAMDEIVAAYQDSGFTGLASQLGQSLASIGVEIAGMVPGLINAGVDMLQQFLAGITGQLSQVSTAGAEIVTSLVTGVVESSASLFNAGIQVFAGLFEGLESKVPDIMQAGYKAVSLILTSLQAELPGMIQSGAAILLNVIKGITNALPSLLPIVQQIFTNLVSSITQNLPTIVQSGMQLLQTLAEGVISAIPNLLPAIAQVLTSIVQIVTENLPTIIQLGMQLLSTLAQGIAQQLPQLVPTIVDAILTIVDTLIANIDTIIDAGIQIILALAQGLIEALPQLIERVPEIINAFWDAFDQNLFKILEAGAKLIVTLGKGIIESIPTIIENAGEIVKAIFNTIMHLNMIDMGKNLITNLGKGIKQIGGAIKEASRGILDKLKAPFENFSFTGLGKNIVNGIVDGIKSVGSLVGDALGGVVDGAVSWVKSLLGIASPSKLMRDLIGKNMIAGIGVGFELESGNLNKQAQDTVEDAVKSMQNIDAKAVVGNMQAATLFKADVITSGTERNMNAVQAEDKDAFELDYGRLEQAFGRAIRGMKVEMEGKPVGEIVTPYIDRNSGTAISLKLRGAL